MRAMMRLPGRRLLLGLVAVVSAVALWVGPPGARANRPAARAPGHERTWVRRHRGRPTVIVRWTSYGIPHIWATTYFGAGEGYGYAFAQDNICTIANDYVTVDGQRSRFFGPNATYTQVLNGTTASNIDSDFYWQQIIDSGIIDKLLARRAPYGPVEQIKQGVAGYVNGYNRYLRSVGGSRGVSDPRCRGKAWVRPITTADVYRRFYQLVELASGGVVIQGIAEAAPPTPAHDTTALSAGVPSLDRTRTAELLARLLPDGMSGAVGIGSNAVAVGRAGTRDHRHGLLLANPHLTWTGDERVYQAQITVPGQMNVEGASLYGVPFVQFGHDATLAWSETVSTARRFTPIQLKLVPGSPTTYLYDGKQVRMTHRTVTVQALQPDGSLKPVTRTLYSSRFGPIFNQSPLVWTTATALTLGDANADNFRSFNTFFDLGRAHNVFQALRILQDTEGMPWNTTLAADKQGNALYADIGSMPNVTDAKAKACDTPLGVSTFETDRLPILDGSRSSCNWGTSPGAVKRGLFAPRQMPYLIRHDYVTNSNDSYWLSNPHQPLTGFARIIGDTGTPRSLRTRIGLIMTQDRASGTDGLGPAGFTVKDMENMVFSDRQYAGELTRGPLVAMCRSFPGGLAPTDSGAPIAVGRACDILAHWDLHENLNSEGAELFRLFWDHADGSTATTAVSPFSTPFNVNDPVHTPSGLNTSDPAVRTALGDAIQDLEGAHIPLDATPGDVQAVVHDGVRIPIHGGPGDPNGEFNAIGSDFTSGKGFGPIIGGSSFVQVVSWNNGQCPIGGSILTFSQSENPVSPHFDDQTKLFSQKRWIPDRFCTASVLRDTKRTMVLDRAG